MVPLHHAPLQIAVPRVPHAERVSLCSWLALAMPLKSCANSQVARWAWVRIPLVSCPHAPVFVFVFVCCACVFVFVFVVVSVCVVVCVRVCLRVFACGRV